ncbi:MAG: histidine kinase [Betaproteobacteria bacterium]|nr:histidine kinase [Betaproteobacteria bacterium]
MTGKLPRYYPKSFPRLILMGLGLVMLPLAVAIGYAVFTLQGLSHSAEAAVERAAMAARTTRQMDEVLTFMERVSRQYLVLHDKALLEDYGQARSDLEAVTREVRAAGLSESAQQRLDALLHHENLLHEWLRGISPPDSPMNQEQAAADLGRRLQEIAGDADAVLLFSRAVAGDEVARLQAEANQARDALWLTLAGAGPLALLLAWGFRRLIAAQIRQVDEAIRALGRADYARPIAVSGPDDLAVLGERLDWLRRRLAELEDQKSRFLRHVSHDLKTPLTSLREGAQLLSDGVAGSLGEQQRSIVSIMSNSALRLQQLIEQLLDYQRASVAVAELDVQPVALDGLCAQVLESQRLAAEGRGIELRRELQAVQVDGDPAKLRGVVENLLTNALKFSPHGAVVTVRLWARGEQAILEVADEGPGVAEQERERIFEPFFRGTRRGEVEGSGLGLAIAREYVLSHRGSIDVTSDDGGGACFRVSLPKSLRA